MNKKLLEAAAKPFGSVAALSRASGVPVRTLFSFAESEGGGSACLGLALRIIATHPKMAREICKLAREWKP